jgi:hypothetical protein
VEGWLKTIDDALGVVWKIIAFGARSFAACDSRTGCCEFSDYVAERVPRSRAKINWCTAIFGHCIAKQRIVNHFVALQYSLLDDSALDLTAPNGARAS